MYKWNWDRRQKDIGNQQFVNRSSRVGVIPLNNNAAEEETPQIEGLASNVMDEEIDETLSENLTPTPRIAITCSPWTREEEFYILQIFL